MNSYYFLLYVLVSTAATSGPSFAASNGLVSVLAVRKRADSSDAQKPDKRGRLCGEAEPDVEIKVEQDAEIVPIAGVPSHEHLVKVIMDHSSLPPVLANIIAAYACSEICERIPYFNPLDRSYRHRPSSSLLCVYPIMFGISGDYLPWASSYLIYTEASHYLRQVDSALSFALCQTFKCAEKCAWVYHELDSSFRFKHPQIPMDPPLTLGTLYLLQHLLGDCTMRALPRSDRRVARGQESSTLCLAPHASFRDVIRSFSNLAITLHHIRERLPSKQFLLKGAVDLNCLLDAYHVHKSVFTRILNDTTDTFVPVFYLKGYTSLNECIKQQRDADARGMGASTSAHSLGHYEIFL